jgi:hypothetical protein
MIGWPVGLVSVLLSRPGELVVAVTGFVVYPTGFEFSLVLKSATMRVDRGWFDALRDEPRSGSAAYVDVSSMQTDKGTTAKEWVGGAETGALIDLTLEFPDGRTFVNRQVSSQGTSPAMVSPHVMTAIGASGADGRAQDIRYWVEPLPDEGIMVFKCTWKLENLRGQAEIDTRLLRAAVSRALLT